MQDATEPYYMYKKITTARDVANVLLDFLEWKKIDTVWFTLPDLLEFISLDEHEQFRILRILRNSLHHRHGIDKKVYVYAIRECDPTTKRKYRFNKKVHEYLIGTKREIRVRDLSGVPSELLQEVKETKVL